MNRLTLDFKLICERALGDKDVGEVHVPIKELLDSPAKPGADGKQFVSYQVRKPSGKPKGQLSFSYQFSEKTVGASAAPPYASAIPLAPPSGKADTEPVTAYPAGSSLAYPPPGAYPPPAPYPAAEGGSHYPPPVPYPTAEGSGHYPPPAAYPKVEGSGHYPPPGGYPPPPAGGAYPSSTTWGIRVPASSSSGVRVPASSSTRIRVPGVRVPTAGTGAATGKEEQVWDGIRGWAAWRGHWWTTGWRYDIRCWGFRRWI
ncbi:UNVERIFIED_CONTAM: protein SRC2 [Sesamum calycinum]|uniref:Protein SRC2 n=1 Tax=Sesamum calycinum TaxID=2727403 RepID=A0AAW2R9U6_9LAMI